MTKYFLHALLFLLLALGCQEANTQSNGKHIIASTDSLDTNPNDVETIEEHSYAENTSAVDFFNQLVKNHQNDFQRKFPAAYPEFLRVNNLKDHVSNQNLFFKLFILHKLFTSRGAYNGARGEILNIPYFWHWVTPNPRHSIQSLKHKAPLNTVKPPKAFGRYNSYADIDRTPGLFLQEWFSEDPLYYTPENDTFNTFGWCSEREMAFVCLLEIMGFKGKVVAKGNHSWTELFVEAVDSDGNSKVLIATVDNTFDELRFEEKENLNVDVWYAKVGEHRLQKWYNQKARSLAEKNEVKNIKGSIAVYSGIERCVVDFLNKP